MPDLINTLTPAVDYTANELTPTGYLSATIDIIVYAHNYNDLSNKPSINSITLSGNKTASDLGLAVPSDITVTSVNTKTGAVVLDGTDINYDTNTSINAKINDIESQIASSGVLSVNGMTGTVILDGSDINYAAGVSLNSKIDAIESEIPVVSYPVTSVNTKTGAVVLDGSDIKYDTNTTINAKIDAVEGEIPTVDYPVTSVNGQTGDVTISVPTTDNNLPHYTGTPTAGSTAEAIKDLQDHTVKTKTFSVQTNILGEVDINNTNLGYLRSECVIVAATTDISTGNTIYCDIGVYRANQNNWTVRYHYSDNTPVASATFNATIYYILL